MLATEAQAKLEGVTFSVRHIGKEENVRADKLSRLGTDMSSPLEEILSSTKRVQKTRMVRTDFQKVIGVGDLAELFDRQQKDPLLIGLVKRCQQAPRNEIVDNGSVFRLQERDGVRVLVRVVRIAGVPFDNFRTVLVHPVEETELKSLVEMYHDRIGHLNDRATRWHISRDWWWPGMRSMIKKICRGCKRCGDVILQRPFSVCPDNVLDYADCCKAPWQMVSGDLCGPLPMSKGYTYCLVLCDHYSRYTVVKGMKSSTAKDLVSIEQAVSRRSTLENALVDIMFEFTLLTLGVLSRMVYQVSPIKLSLQIPLLRNVDSEMIT
ncbi:hypothetical protein Pmar_PMAR019578 [Perkinsus marinus ATCC 50983]|uniref:Integrase zinc-binding domain-containing protein n=1 Tax=Perkinsus marinus (strain ATCC 50983 / TXsc) TaxID=423536 RepID=C5LGH5_PERM5|nr:hypothetical protein Pmar_PMAR019578 [Perkinsus marinus ATCC 50983]EER04161.1 hypothetical protein Pmar_PMAR019578 [Perkinsus marinus ATCC 50983]|eukprot:XP_002772345.1 hypothetical protein Pmar_PMAR019578 [Perkinsus marinus ATCC 50983]